MAEKQKTIQQRIEVKFQVFKDGKLTDEFTPCGAYLFGADGIAIRRAKITFKNGLLECKKPNEDTAGLALLWPIDGFGKVLLPTTVLPEKGQPYNLNIEIARAKLMQIINKREEWSFFDNNNGDMANLSEAAQDLFIQAIQSISEPALASKLADKSLENAIVFSERMATKQAGTLFKTRSDSHGFGRACLGCCIDPAEITNPKYVERLLELFGFVTVPIDWAQIEANKGIYDFSKIDPCINVLAKKKLVIGAGPLLRFSKQRLPGWLLRGKISFEKILEAAYQFVANVVSRYSTAVRAWRVVSGLNAFNHFGFSFEQVLEISRAAIMATKTADNRAIKIIELTNPWGEYYAMTPNTIPPLVYLDMVIQSGISFDAFGLAMQFGSNQLGMHIRDMMQISAVLDYFAAVAKPLYIADLAIPSCSGDGLYDGEAAGIWHKQLDQNNQQQWIEQFYKIALSKPFVDAVSYANLADTKAAVIANSGLLDEQLEPKKSFAALKKIHEAIFTR
jgi:hypothetical protein